MNHFSSKSFGVEINLVFFISLYCFNTAKLKPDWTVGSGFSSISPSNLGQIPKSGTVLKSAHSQLFKTVPDFEIWPTISWENWDWRYQVSMVWQKIIILLDKKAPLVSLISIFFAYSWSNFKIRDSFEKLRTCRFQNCPWFWNLTKIWWRNWGKTRSNWVDWFWLYCSIIVKLLTD